MSPHTLFIWTITVMSSVGLFATDIYLPALPEMAEFFSCTQVEIQTSFTVFLLGLATCQLLAGFLSDRFGRKRIAMIGLSVFTLACILCALSNSLTEFLFLRLLQAMGGGVGSVVCRAIVASRFDRQETIRIFSTIFPVIGLSGAIAPFVGGFLTHYLGWQSTFYFMACFGILALVLVHFFLTDVLSEQKKPETAGNRKSIKEYFGIFVNFNFMSYVLVICSSFCALRAYTAQSPFVFDNQGYFAEEMGCFYISLSLAYLAGNLVAKRLVKKIIMEAVLTIGFAFFIVGGLSMIISTFYFSSSPFSIILPMTIITFANGFLFPTSSAAALSSVSSQFVGLASGVMGASQYVTAAFCIHWVGRFSEGKALLLSLFIASIILLGFANFLFLMFYRFSKRLRKPESSEVVSSERLSVE
jgi:DHA1 family bicyclomycin/chloramphenicol resistance-like MFS transporter